MAPSTAVERRAAQRRATKRAKDDGASAQQLLLAGDFAMSALAVAVLSLTAEAAEALAKVWGRGAVGGP